ncbi:sialate O-acetylesterase [Salmonirosea aquatica]
MKQVISVLIFWAFRVITPVQANAQTPLKLADVFGSGMVLQRDQPLRIYGKAAPGAAVSIRLFNPTDSGRKGQKRNKSQTRVAADSTWQITLTAQGANAKPQILRIISQGDTLTLTNVLIGDVWVCAGQSNMAFMLKDDRFAAAALKSAANANLGLLNWQPSVSVYNVPYKVEEIPNLRPENFYRPSGWEAADSTSARNFSAVGFYFGQMVQRETGVPVGLITVAVGGSPAEAWLRPEAVVSGQAELKPIFRGNWFANESLEPWCRERGHQNLDSLLVGGSTLPGDSLGINHPFKPGFLYRAGIESLLGLPIRGVLWYQGESNALSLRRTQQHEQLFPALVRDWRAQWGQGAFPFYFCQLSSIGTEKGYRSEYWPEFRDSQRRMAERIPNVAMAVTSDVGHPSDVHPTDKKTVGKRLARVALAGTYRKKVAARGPSLQKIQQQGNRLVLTFKDAAKGLRTQNDQPLAGFELEDAAGVRHPAEAIISGKNVFITNPQSGHWQRVLYGWQPFSGGNLQNAAGLPASTFQMKIDQSIKH